MKRVVVTGGSGKAGRWVVRDLVEHGFEVLNVDWTAPADRSVPFLVVDLTDFGQTVEALRGYEAVVHLAAIPAPGIRTTAETFRINILSTYNVFSAAVQVGMERVVWASSETTLGLPYSGRYAKNLLEGDAVQGHQARPDYVPVDEDHPLRPNSSYALSKVLGEEMGRHFARWTGIPFIALRFSNVLDPEEIAEFAKGMPTDQREWNVWSYVDARDTAQSCRAALTADVTGAEAFIIAAGDTVMERPNAELMAERFPDVEMREGSDGNRTILGIDKARRMLGYDPQHTWRAAAGSGEG